MRYGNPSKKTRVIASKQGHAIEFPGRGTVAKGDMPKEYAMDDTGIVYVPVPGAKMQAEVAAAGMVAETEIEEKDDPKTPVRPEDATELQKQVYAAFDKIVEAADRESFGGHGVPKPTAVEKTLGYPLNNSEVKEFWTKYQVDKKS